MNKKYCGRQKIMKNKLNNFAYIDGANLHKGVESLGWDMDYQRFRIWLSEKYRVKSAYLFIGLIPRYRDLYKYLQECGFTLVFKEVVYDGDGRAKGNCDADLVLHTVCDAYESKFEKAIIVSSDGDYASLVEFLKKREKLKTILSPNNEKKCSILLKRTDAPIAYLNDQISILQIHPVKSSEAGPLSAEFNRVKKEKAPDADKTA